MALRRRLLARLVCRALASLRLPPRPAQRQQAGGGGGRGAATPEQQAAQKAAAEETRKWRMGVSMDKVKEFRKKYEDAGVLIEIVKWDGIFDFSDDELDYAFQVSKALGARALSSEITIGQTKKLGQFADKHKMQVGYHGHAGVTPAIWEATFAEASTTPPTSISAISSPATTRRRCRSSRSIQSASPTCT